MPVNTASAAVCALLGVATNEEGDMDEREQLQGRIKRLLAVLVAGESAPLV